MLGQGYRAPRGAVIDEYAYRLMLEQYIVRKN
jgi:hypothetical protein